MLLFVPAIKSLNEYRVNWRCSDIQLSATSKTFRAIMTLKLVYDWQTGLVSRFEIRHLICSSDVWCLYIRERKREVRRRERKREGNVGRINERHWLKFCFFQMQMSAVLVVLLSNLYIFLKHSISKMNILHHVIDIFTFTDAFRMLFFLDALSLVSPCSDLWAVKDVACREFRKRDFRFKHSFVYFFVCLFF